jgi:single-stranded DNA-specific DHH superfamily exonuclease
MIMTVDNGIVTPVSIMPTLGIPVLVTDHHLPGKRCRPPKRSLTQPARLRFPVEIWPAWVWRFI